MTNTDKLNALMGEARRRGVTYGELTARLTPEETQRIYDRYMGRHREKEVPERTQNTMEWRGAHLRKRRQTFDAKRAMELYRQGRNDREIAGELGVIHGTVYKWRHREGLPPAAKQKRRDST